MSKNGEVSQKFCIFAKNLVTWKKFGKEYKIMEVFMK